MIIVFMNNSCFCTINLPLGEKVTVQGTRAALPHMVMTTHLFSRSPPNITSVFTEQWF